MTAAMTLVALVALTSSAAATPLAPYNTVYANRCASGCVVKPGTSNSIANTWGISAQSTLTSFPHGDQAWNDVVACLRDVLSPFKVNVVDSNPGSANHFEVMIAGLSSDLGLPPYGGVAPGGCHMPYLNNGLVFAFARTYGSGTTCDATCVNQICRAAAQELGHIWGMDHVTTPSDPMTYFSYSKRRYFQDTDMLCGSDCVNGVSPSGVQCTALPGTITPQVHPCRCTGSATQNTYATLKSLFELGPGSPPTVKILGPTVGERVEAGFPVIVEPTDDSGTIERVDIKVDGVLVGSLTAAPWVLTAPAALIDGNHHVEVIAFDPHNTPGTTSVDVVSGPCADESDCSAETDVCVGGRCVPGPSVDGGLGARCMAADDCLSNQCGNDGTLMYCVEPCMTGECPSAFGCLDTGAGDGTGVCWPGHVEEAGGCGCQSSGPGSSATLLSLFTLVGLARRKRRPRRLS